MRKEIDFKVEDEGRDSGKIFHITEMACEKAEDWAMRALVTLAKFGFTVPDRFTGMAGIASVGFQNLSSAGVAVPEIRELMTEMMTCVTVPVTDQANPKKVVSYRQLEDVDIEEVITRLRLRLEVFKLQTGFSFAELFLKWTSPATEGQGASPSTQGSARQ